MRKLALASVLIGLSAVQAYSQSSQQVAPDRAPKTLLQLQDEEDKRRAKDIDADYERAMKRSRAAPNAAFDPWQNVRPAGK